MVTRIIVNLHRQGDVFARSWMQGGGAGMVVPHSVCDSAKI
jgi:hypothetical protein